MIPDAETPEDGVLDIEGPIDEHDWWGDGSVTGSREFRKALEGLGNVTVRINSPGGDVMAGAEIYSALREHSMNGKGRIKVIITALAASAASVIAMAGDEILISPVAYMMIHNPWSFAIGDAKEMRKTAKTLDEITEGLISAYQRRTGKSRDELKRMLENETWMSAGKAVDEGFADAIWGEEIRAAACVSATSMTRATPESIREMCRRWEQAHAEAADPEKDPDEPEEDPEEPEEAPEEEPEEDPEEKPEEEPEKDPADETETAVRAEISRRAAILAGIEW